MAIELNGTDLRSARLYAGKITEARGKLKELDQQIKELTAPLNEEKMRAQEVLAKAEASLVELLELGNEPGTFRCEDPKLKIEIRGDYKAEEISEALTTLKAALGDKDALADVVLPSKREFSKTGYNTVGKMVDLSEWFANQITIKLGTPKVTVE